MLLGYYLKYGAEIEVGADYMWLGEDFSLDLDVAMAARREGIRGAPTPQGILTAFREHTPWPDNRRLGGEPDGLGGESRRPCYRS